MSQFPPNETAINLELEQQKKTFTFLRLTLLCVCSAYTKNIPSDGLWFDNNIKILKY